MMESLLERLDGWLTTSDRYCVVSLSLYRYTLFSNCIHVLYYCPYFCSPWLIGPFFFYYFVLFSSIKGQSGTVIATVLPTLAGRHNSTLTIIPNSGCLPGLRSSRHSLTCYEGIHISSCVVYIHDAELYPLRPVYHDQ